MRISDFLRLPEEERSRTREAAAAVAVADYRNNPDLTAFNAFGDTDMFDEHDSE